MWGPPIERANAHAHGRGTIVAGEGDTGPSRLERAEAIPHFGYTEFTVPVELAAYCGIPLCADRAALPNWKLPNPSVARDRRSTSGRATEDSRVQLPVG